MTTEERCRTEVCGIALEFFLPNLTLKSINFGAFSQAEDSHFRSCSISMHSKLDPFRTATGLSECGVVMFQLHLAVSL